MTNKEKLIETLRSTKSGFQLEDIKFALSFDRFVSEDEFCDEIIKAEDQIEAGLAVPVSVKAVDGNFKSRTADEFLA